MLRTLGTNRSRRPPARYATFAVVALVGLAAAGLRGPGVTDGVAQAEEPAVQADTVSQYDFSFVPENIFGLVAIRPAELVADPRLQPLAKLLEQATRSEISAEVTEQATLVFVAPDFDAEGRMETGSGGEQFIIHTTQPIDFEQHLRKANSTLTTEEHDGRELFVISPSPYTISYFSPEETTLIGRGRTGLLKLLNEPDASTSPADAELWQSEVKGPLLVVVREFALGMLLRQSLRSSVTRTGLRQMAGALAPLVNGVETIVFSVDAGERLQLHGLLKCRSPYDVSRVVETIDAVGVLARQTVDALRTQQSTQGVTLPGFHEVLSVVIKAIDERQIITDGSDVRIETTLGETEAVVKLVTDTLAPALESARERTQSVNDLKQLAFAMHNYDDDRGSLPPAVSYTYRKNGEEHTSEHPHSWRVAILPFLNRRDIYEQYRFDEPWDSEVNKKVLKQMPEVFRSPHDEPGSTNTSYFVFTGPETIFHDEGGTRLQRITDGTSRTFLFVEAKRPVPWTKPEDISYAANQPVPKLGGWVPGEFLAAMASGDVRRVSTDIDEETLRASITKAGREIIEQLPKPKRVR